MTLKIVPVTEFRTHVLQAVRNAQTLGQEYIITSKGKPAAILMNFEDWEGLMETLEIKKDKKLIAEIKKNKKYFERGGKGISHLDIKWDENE